MTEATRQITEALVHGDGPPTYNELPHKTAFVAPAFDRKQANMPGLNVTTKDDLLRSLRYGDTQIMHAAQFPPSYLGPLNTGEWFFATYPFTVSYTQRWEPYYFARLPVPLFDERFVNRGLNKAQQQFAMFAQGYKHVVMPGMFVVDTPMPAVQVGARGVKRLSAEAGFLKFDWKYLDKLWPTFLRQTLKANAMKCEQRVLNRKIQDVYIPRCEKMMFKPDGAFEHEYQFGVKDAVFIRAERLDLVQSRNMSEVWTGDGDSGQMEGLGRPRSSGQGWEKIISGHAAGQGLGLDTMHPMGINMKSIRSVGKSTATASQCLPLPATDYRCLPACLPPARAHTPTLVPSELLPGHERLGAPRGRCDTVSPHIVLVTDLDPMAGRREFMERPRVPDDVMAKQRSRSDPSQRPGEYAPHRCVSLWRRADGRTDGRAWTYGTHKRPSPCRLSPTIHHI